MEVFRSRGRSPGRPDRSGRLTSLVISLLGHGLLAAILFPILVSELPRELPPQTTFVHWHPNPPEEEKVAIETKEDPPPIEEKAPPPESLTEVMDEVPEVREVIGAAPGEIASETSAIGERAGGRASALKIHGGSQATEGAVNSALQWLARHQDSDGSWSPRGFHRHCESEGSEDPCAGAGFPEYRIGVTALATLAFLGAGADHTNENPWRDTVASAIRWLRLQQQTDGCFGPAPGDGKRDLYNHGLATFAIVEAAHLSGDPELLEPARASLDFIASSQQPSGGWDYTPARTLRNDLSVTGWQLMAIEAGREMKLLPHPPTIAGAKRFVRRAVSRRGAATYSNRGSGAGRQGVSIAAVGLLCRLYLDWSPRSAESSRAANLILASLPDPDLRADWDSSFQSMYYWYSATLALFHIGGENWQKWNRALQEVVLPLQVSEGEAKGSWPPDPNWIGQAGGRVASTALGALTFEVYYRYTPLYMMLGLARRDSERGKRGATGEAGKEYVAPGKGERDRSPGDH